MSRNTDKITKALLDKGYQPKEMCWNPIRSGPEMCGPEGGWYIEVETVSLDDDGDHEYVDVLLAYSMEELMEEINELPSIAPSGNPHQSRIS